MKSNVVKSVALMIEAITLITLVTLCDGPEPSSEVPKCPRVLVGVSVPMGVEGGTHHRAVLLPNRLKDTVVIKKTVCSFN